MSKRPHIIIFNPDEMRADSMHHLGKNEAAVTPNFDSFAQTDAVSFSNAYCQNPVCVPSRCSFFTGLYPHTTGHRTMSYLLRPGESSMFKELKDAGYYVWMNDRNDLCAGQYEGWLEEHADEIYVPHKGGRPLGAVNENIRGEQGGRYYYSHYEGELKTNERGINYSPDDESVEAAIEKIKSWKDGDKPLCIFLGLFYPHPPYQVEEPFFSAIDRDKLPERIKYEDVKDKNEMMRLYHEYQNLEGLSEEEWNEIRATYAGMCMKVDWQFGRLTEALKEAGMYDDSAIFVVSDHGDFAGDFGFAEKAQNLFEDCLTNVPFLIKPPAGIKVDAGVSSSMTELIDLYATVMDMTGTEPAHEHFGKSLVSVLGDRSEEVRDYVFSEGGRLPGEIQCDEYHNAVGETSGKEDVYWPKKMAQADDTAHAKATMIRNKKYKYISRTLGRDEFYDLEKDPKELKNEIDNAYYREQILEMKDEMLKWLQKTSDVVPYDFDSRFTAQMLWAKVKPIVAPENEALVKEKIKSGIGIGELFGFCLSLRRK